MLCCVLKHHSGFPACTVGARRRPGTGLPPGRRARTGPAKTCSRITRGATCLTSSLFHLSITCHLPLSPVTCFYHLPRSPPAPFSCILAPVTCQVAERGEGGEERPPAVPQLRVSAPAGAEARGHRAHHRPLQDPHPPPSLHTPQPWKPPPLASWQQVHLLSSPSSFLLTFPPLTPHSSVFLFSPLQMASPRNLLR